MATRCLTVIGKERESVSPRCVNVALSVAVASPCPTAGRMTSPWAVTTDGSLVLQVRPGTAGSVRLRVIAVVSPRSIELASSARLPGAAASDSARTCSVVSTLE